MGRAPCEWPVDTARRRRLRGLGTPVGPTCGQRSLAGQAVVLRDLALAEIRRRAVCGTHFVTAVRAGWAAVAEEARV